MFKKLIQKAAIPALFSIFLIISQVYFKSFIFLFSEQTLHYLSYFLATITWLTLAWFSSRIINLFFWDGIIAHSLGRPPPYLLKTFTTLLITLIAISGIVGVVFEKSLTGIWATSGILGGIIGFALKDMIADFFTGITMNIDRPFRIGDWILLYDPLGNPIYGCIAEITWRSTRITRLNNTTIIYPNNVMSNMSIHNLSANGEHRRFDLPFTFDSSIEPERIKRILLAAAYSTPGIWNDPAPKVIIETVNRFGVDYQLRFWIDPEAFGPRKAITQVLETALNYLHQANIRLIHSNHRYIEKLPDHVQNSEKNTKIILEKVSFLSCLSNSEKTTLSKCLHPHIFKADETILREGEKGDSLFILIEGFLNVYVQQDLQTSQQTKVGEIHPGETFGEYSLLTGEERSATIIAVTESLIYKIEKKDLFPILQTRPSIVEDLSRIMAEHFLKTQKSKETALIKSQKDTELVKIEQTYLLKIKHFFGL